MSGLIRVWAVAALLVSLLLQGCGGGGDSAPAATSSSGSSGTPISVSSGSSSSATPTPMGSGNVQPIAVNAGPTGQFPNSVMTSVRICLPGTSTCQTISNVMVDTGSSGLRLLASVVTLPLSAVAAPTGGNYSECATFADGVVWGAVVSADIEMAGEKASSMPIQIVQDNGVGAAIPASCTAQGAAEDSLQALGANGLIGIGLFLQDCGADCVTMNDVGYYACSAAGSCTPSTAALVSQVSNPVPFFSQDNNGAILQLPAIADAGVTSVGGSLIFGIGTQSNNALTGTVIPVPDNGASAGAFTASFNGTTLSYSFFDSGSSALYFEDSSIPVCGASSVGDGFYCPGSSVGLSETPLTVTIMGTNAVAVAVTAKLANASFLFNEGNGTLNAFDDLGAPSGSFLPNSFDFGVPFFFGKSVFTGFEQRTTSAGAGPFFAFQ